MAKPSHSSDSNPCRDCADLRSQLETCEANLIRAAEAGQQLINKVKQLETSQEESRQEAHFAQKRMEASLQTQRSCQDEIEGLRETLTVYESRIKMTDGIDKDNEALRQKLLEKENHELQYEDRIRQLEAQYEELLESTRKELNTSIEKRGNVSLSQELLDEHLQGHKLDWLQEKQGLEREISNLIAKQSEVEEQAATSKERVTALEARLKERDSEVATMAEKLSQLKEDKEDLQVELEAVKVTSSVDMESKGNSIFSEVDDRRVKVEEHMQKVREKNEEMKADYRQLQKQMRQLKAKTVQLAHMAGSSSSNHDAEYCKWLEETLETERAKYRMLAEHLAKTESSKMTEVEIAQKPSQALKDPSVLAKARRKSDYSHFEVLLKEARAQNEEQQSAFQGMLRQSILESDKMLAMARKINTLETASSRYKNEICKLQLRNEELRSMKEIVIEREPMKKKKAKFNVEYITDDKENENENEKENENENKPSDEILEQDGQSSSESVLTDSSQSTELSSKKDSRKKKVGYAPSVEVIDSTSAENLASQVSHEPLNTDESKAKIQRKAAGRRLPLIDANSEEEEKWKQECSQQ